MSYGSEGICIVGEEFGAHSPRRGTGKHDFTAYAPDFRTIDCQVWTNVPATYAVECAAFQARLDSGRLSHVVVTRHAMSGAFDRTGENTATRFTMYAREKKPRT